MEMEGRRGPNAFAKELFCANMAGRMRELGHGAKPTPGSCRKSSLASIFLLVAVVLTCSQTGAQPFMQTILTNGPVSNRLNIVILSEGYKTNQLPQFLVDATNAVSTLLSHPPYQVYAGYCNAFAIGVASKQPGSDHPSYPQYRDTYFNSTFDAADRLITIPTNSTGQGRVDALLASFMPRSHLAILLVNDPAAAGSDGFSKTAIVSTRAMQVEASLG